MLHYLDSSAPSLLLVALSFEVSLAFTLNLHLRRHYSELVHVAIYLLYITFFIETFYIHPMNMASITSYPFPEVQQAN